MPGDPRSRIRPSSKFWALRAVRSLSEVEELILPSSHIRHGEEIANL